MHTVHTVMNNLASLRVHLAPVGYEIDRIVLSAKQMKADKVWLLVHEKPSEDKAGPFILKIEKELQKSGIKVAKEHHNRLDLFSVIRSVKEIIEKEKGNSIYVNLASGSKIQSIAMMMACMMFNDGKVIPFYAEAEKYAGFEGKQLSYGVKNLMQLPTYQIQVPRRDLIDALKIIKEHGGKITKKEMARIADEEKLIDVNAREENYSQARFASLDKNIIQPLENTWKFIEVDKIGRNRWIKITKEGENAAEFLIG